MKKIFGNITISYKFIIVFSIIIGILVGGLNRIPIFINTSLTDPSVYLEFWVVLAIFIIVNSKSYKDVAIKCFLFFLISQPIIYLSEIIIDSFLYNKVFINLIKEYFLNYYFGGGKWFLITILTIPGSLIAYKIKDEKVISAIILSIATIFLSYTGISYLLNSIFYNFPRHIISGLFCLFFAYYFIFIILKNKKQRIVSFVITSIGIIISFFIFFKDIKNPVLDNQIIDIKREIKSYVSEDESIVKVSISDDNTYVLVTTSKNIGNTIVKIIDVNDKEYTYNINVSHKKLIIK